MTIDKYFLSIGLCRISKKGNLVLEGTQDSRWKIINNKKFIWISHVGDKRIVKPVYTELRLVNKSAFDLALNSLKDRINRAGSSYFSEDYNEWKYLIPNPVGKRTWGYILQCTDTQAEIFTSEDEAYEYYLSGILKKKKDLEEKRKAIMNTKIAPLDKLIKALNKEIDEISIFGA